MLTMIEDNYGDEVDASKLMPDARSPSSPPIPITVGTTPSHTPPPQLRLSSIYVFRLAFPPPPHRASPPTPVCCARCVFSVCAWSGPRCHVNGVMCGVMCGVAHVRRWRPRLRSSSTTPATMAACLRRKTCAHSGLDCKLRSRRCHFRMRVRLTPMPPRPPRVPVPQGRHHGIVGGRLRRRDSPLPGVRARAGGDGGARQQLELRCTS